VLAWNDGANKSSNGEGEVLRNSNKNPNDSPASFHRVEAFYWFSERYSRSRRFY